MRKIVLLAAVLLMLPLVGTVALTDFNYIGQGGGGLSESDVQTLIDDAAYAPTYDPDSGGCDPADAGDPPANYCTGGASSSYAWVLTNFGGSELWKWRVTPQDVKALPWNSTWTYLLCPDYTTNCISGGAGAYGVGGAGGGSVSLADINSIYVPFDCGDVGPFPGVTILAIDEWGNEVFLTGDQGIILITDVYGTCGGP